MSVRVCEGWDAIPLQLFVSDDYQSGEWIRTRERRGESAREEQVASAEDNKERLSSRTRHAHAIGWDGDGDGIMCISVGH